MVFSGATFIQEWGYPGSITNALSLSLSLSLSGRAAAPSTLNDCNGPTCREVHFSSPRSFSVNFSIFGILVYPCVCRV